MAKRPLRKAFLPRRMSATPDMPMPESAPVQPVSPPVDPGAALNQFAKEQLGGAEYRINRRHPARAPKIAAGSSYQGMTAGQAQLAVEDKFRRGTDPAAALGRAQALEYTPSPAAPQGLNAAFLPRMAGGAPYDGFKNLAAPQKATGQPLGSMKFAKLPTRPMRR